MILPNMIRMIEQHADSLTAEVVADLRSNPRTSYIRRKSTEELERRAHDLFAHPGRFLTEKNEEELEQTFGETARRLHDEDAPLSEVVSVITVIKKHLWEFVKRNAPVDSINDLYQLEEVSVLIGRFFDEATYVAVRKYESIHKHWKDPRLM